MSAEHLARALYAAFPPPAPVGGTRVFPTSWEEQDERWRAQFVVGMQSLLDQGLIAEPAEVERDVIPASPSRRRSPLQGWGPCPTDGDNLRSTT